MLGFGSLDTSPARPSQAD
jgi:hypothetical protein